MELILILDEVLQVHVYVTTTWSKKQNILSTQIYLSSFIRSQW